MTRHLIYWLCAILSSVAIGALPVLDATTDQQDAEATAASVQDATRTARLQAAIDRECTGHAEPMLCAVRVAQQEQPELWTAQQAQRGEAAARVATKFEPSREKP